MKFSIILTTLNSTSKLMKNINALKNINDSEIIVIDCGSSHEVLNKNRNFINSMSTSRIVYYEFGRKIPITYAYNEGRKIAMGKWLFFVDDNIISINKKFIKWLNTEKLNSNFAFYRFNIIIDGKKIKWHKNIGFYTSNISSYLFNSNWYVGNKIHFENNEYAADIYQMHCYGTSNKNWKNEKVISIKTENNKIIPGMNINCESALETIKNLANRKDKMWKESAISIILKVYQNLKNKKYKEKRFCLILIKTMLRITKPKKNNYANFGKSVRLKIFSIRLKTFFVKRLK